MPTVEHHVRAVAREDIASGIVLLLSLPQYTLLRSVDIVRTLLADTQHTVKVMDGHLTDVGFNAPITAYARGIRGRYLAIRAGKSGAYYIPHTGDLLLLMFTGLLTVPTYRIQESFPVGR